MHTYIPNREDSVCESAEVWERLPHPENGRTARVAMAETRIGSGSEHGATWWSLEFGLHVGRQGEGTLELRV